MAYTHLSLEERYDIAVQRKKEGVSLNKMVTALNRSQSSISREMARNTEPRDYRHTQAYQKAQVRHQEKAKAVKLTGRH